MTDDTEDKPIEVRTFATMQEIESLSGFKADNPVNKDNYKLIFGDYWFPDEVKCCRQKLNGQLCGEDHKYGFVAILRDDSITIVGNHCANEKFGADARIKVDKNKYLNEKRRRERLAQLQDLLVEKETTLAQLVGLKEDISKIHENIKAFSALLGDQTRRRLQNIARTTNSTISVDAVTYREYIDDDGEKQKERRTVPVTIGSLKGTSIFNIYTFRAINESIRAIEQAYEKAEAITDDVKISEIDSLASSITDFDRVKSEVEKVKREEHAFFNGELGLLCFIVDDKSERYKTARVVLERSGETVGREKAKNWLLEQEKKMKNELEADKIEIKY